MAMPMLDLDDLAQLRAELQVLDEHDMLAELQIVPTRRGSHRARCYDAVLPVHPYAAHLRPPDRPGSSAASGAGAGGSSGQEQAVPRTRPLPPVPGPSPEAEPVRRTGPLPPVTPCGPAPDPGVVPITSPPPVPSSTYRQDGATPADPSLGLRVWAREET